MEWWRTRVTLPAWPACKAGLDPCPFPDWNSKRCSVGWAKSHREASTRGQGAYAILPTRKRCAARLAHPTKSCLILVPRVGFEPTSLRLQRSAFTRSASWANWSLGELERPEGNDPSSQRWHRYALPLSYGRVGGCGTDSNLHSTEAPGYSRLGFPIPYTPQIGCRSASRTRRRTAYETARATRPTCNERARLDRRATLAAHRAASKMAEA
jgi:hypothetical protein